MTREEKSAAIHDYCENRCREIGCDDTCPLHIVGENEYCFTLDGSLPCNIDRNYSIVFGNDEVDLKNDEIEFIKVEHEETEQAIKDSGNRREFSTGAVRDMAEGKGRCDLMPLDVVACEMRDEIINYISKFKATHDICYLHSALGEFCRRAYKCGTIEQSAANMFLEVAKHFEDGAKKYGENNWQKGLPVDCYIDSAVRHYLKWLRGDKDEPHDRAFVWNILCCIWTVKHKGSEQ